LNATHVAIFNALIPFIGEIMMQVIPTLSLWTFIIKISITNRRASPLPGQGRGMCKYLFLDAKRIADTSNTNDRILADFAAETAHKDC
jgi:hypothetical protein